MDRKEEKALQEALKIIEAKVEKLDTELERYNSLRQERDTAYGTLIHLRASLGMPPYPPSKEIVPNPAQKPLWADAQEVLAQSTHEMSAPEIVEALRKRGRKLEGKWDAEAVRAALARKPELFERVGRGMFRLKK